jgi:glutamyl/glutaminyl-tRNA synthetase
VEFKRRLEEFRGGEKVDSRVVPLLKERSRTFKEAADAIAAGEYRFLDDSILYDPQLLLQGAKAEAVAVKSNLGSTKTSLEALSDEDFTAEKIKEVIFPFATQQGRASVLWPMRVALSGKEKSPDPFTLAGLLGKEKTLKRIEEAVKML